MRTKNCDRVTIDIPKELHIQLKLLSILQPSTMREHVIKAMEEYLKKYEDIYEFKIDIKK